MMKISAGLAVIAFLSITTAGAQAQDYPARPVQIVVPYSAGGATDLAVRTIVNEINRDGTLGQPVVVINVAGGGGPVGFNRVRDADPDGYEILATHVGLMVGQAVGTTPFGLEAFEPVAQTGSIRYISAVSSDAPYDSFEVLRQAVQAAPGEIAEANSIGGAIHMASLALAEAADYEMRMVHVGGGAERLSSILGGITQHSLFTVSEFLNAEQAGLRALAYLAPERHPQLSDVPSTAELGYGDGISVDTWWFMPLGTPSEVVETFADALEAALGVPDLQESLRNMGIEPTFSKGDEFAEMLTDVNEQVQAAAPLLRGE